MAILMIFIDGLGIGLDNPKINPLSKADLPFIHETIRGNLTKTTISNEIINSKMIVKTIDAGLSVPGLPQSATGQTSLFTGINAAQATGRHINGFPTKALYAILENDSIFKKINRTGRKGIFANTFTKEYFEAVRRGRWRYSASTAAAMAGNCQFLMIEDLNQGYAVYQDLTNEQLQQKNYSIPLITPETAGVNLLRQAKLNDFTLFEYFQTDHCGHAQDFDLAMVLLNRLDRFIGTVVRGMPPDFSLIITSDHGNIEDLSVKTHTLNPVPLIVFGPEASKFSKAESLTDICPLILASMGISV
ncbi:MAG: metalloenzyme [Firmicutes bacterium]|nr:metalloenzyme [Bacillota bacterium]